MAVVDVEAVVNVLAVVVVDVEALVVDVAFIIAVLVIVNCCRNSHEIRSCGQNAIF